MFSPLSRPSGFPRTAGTAGRFIPPDVHYAEYSGGSGECVKVGRWTLNYLGILTAATILVFDSSPR
jgi:hypothetical protein